MAGGVFPARALLGHHDDGTDDGIVLVKSQFEGLVKLPIRSAASTWLSSIAGSGVVGYTPVQYNPDGSNYGVSMTAPAVTSGNPSAVSLETTLWGRRIGVRLRRSSTSVPFTLIVDGVPYAVRAVQQRRHAAATISTTDYEALLCIADDLGPGPHTVRVHLAGAPIGGASRNIILLGFLVDREAGYEPKRKAGTIAQAPTTLTTTQTLVPTNAPSQLVTRMWFENTDASTRVVTVQINGHNLFKKSLAAGVTDYVDFGEPVQINSALGMKWAADAGAVVNAWLTEVN